MSPGQQPPHAGFVVAIVGGGLAGLAVALHMDRIGMDWVMLEAHDEVAPQLGASIGMHPSSMKILDQLGVHDEFLADSGTASNTVVYDGQGGQLYSMEMQPGIRAGHGFDMRFAERRTLLQLLHRHIKNKDRIFTGQRVSSIEHVGGGDGRGGEWVRISTAAGRTFTADVVVGGDGIHSKVRAEMWRAAREDGRCAVLFGSDDPGSRVETEYGCVFGISENSPLPAEVVRQVHMPGESIAIMTRDGGVAYWFYFWRLDAKHLGLDLPRFTEADEARLVRPHLDRTVHPGVTFGDVYRGKTRSAITPLPNNFFNRWHYRRIVCIGDSVVKTQPIAGQGGGSVLESAAALVDCLHDATQAGGAGGRPSSQQVEAAFARLAELRHVRCSKIVDGGLMIMRLSSWANWLFRIVDSYIIWLVPNRMIVETNFAGSRGSYESTTLPAPVERYARGTGEPLKAVAVADS